MNTGEAPTILIEEKPAKQHCAHCGDPIGTEDICHAEQHFCCQGCLLVWQLFEDTGLERPDFAGLRPQKARSGEFDYLRDTTIARTFLDFDNEKHARVRLHLPAVHCSSCIYLLENLPRLAPGVISARLNFGLKEASVHFDPQAISLHALVSLLSSIGYRPDLSHDHKGSSSKQKTGRQAQWRLVVAAVCFGNIMLLSFPAYLGLEDPELLGIFGWINLGLSLPVVLYSAAPYFLGAWRGLRHQHLTIDLPIALGVLTLFGRSLWDIAAGMGPGYADSLAGLVFFLLLGRWFQDKTFRSLSFERDYRAYFPLYVLRSAGTEEVPVRIQDLRVGDEIIVRHEEIIPADATLLSPEAQIDYRFVTGEEDLQHCAQGAEVFAGGRQQGGRIRLRVLRPGSHAYLTSLWNEQAFSHDKAENRQQLINRVSQYFTPAILLIATLAALWWSYAGGHEPLAVFTAVLIVACPCALALAAPFTHGFSLRNLGRAGLYLRHAEVAEALANIDTIVLDKTGTLTDHREAVARWQGAPLGAKERQLLAGLVASSMHPMSRQIGLLLGAEVAPAIISDFEEILGKGIRANVDGQQLQLGAAAWCGQEGKGTWLLIDGEPRGCFTSAPRLRKGLEEMIAALGTHYRLEVLSGDQEQDRAMLEAVFPAGTQMHFRQQPADKLRHIEALQAAGRRVMMVGDGLNDAGALRQSHVGIAVTDDMAAFSPACDGILQGAQLSRLHLLLRYARQAKGVLLAGFVLSLLYNVVGLSLAISGQLSPLLAAILMPLSSLTVVGFAAAASQYLSTPIR